MDQRRRTHANKSVIYNKQRDKLRAILGVGNYLERPLPFLLLFYCVIISVLWAYLDEGLGTKLFVFYTKTSFLFCPKEMQ